MLSRRSFLRTTAALGAGVALGGTSRLAGAAFGRQRKPDSLPYPTLPEGTDTLPEIEHVIVLMMENHSFDNYLGVLGRGNGFRLRNGRLTNWNPYGPDRLYAFHMPNTCQFPAEPNQSWNASHIAYAGGRMDGFVEASGPVAMGYWTEDDIPFYHALARTFPLADRWFGSCLAQTYPNRRFLMAGTANGIISSSTEAILVPPPPNGTIFDRFAAHGVSWKNYYVDVPSAAIILETVQKYPGNLAPVATYFADAAAGTLPFFSLVDPAFVRGQSEENPDDIRVGETFAASVIRAAMQGPAWPTTLLIWCYDEHGGYYDHVRPPRAVRPDDTPPMIHVPPDRPGLYDRYGFRVPAVLVSPRARPDYVSHVLHDHTSILALVEKKWNLPAMTFRDANADDLLDSLDLVGPPAFLDPPTLPDPAPAGSCTPGDPGVIPPPDAVVPGRA